MARPTRVTLPGTVRFTDPANAQALRPIRNYHPKTKAFTGTTITVPAGKRASYEAQQTVISTRPVYRVTLVDDVPADVVHAELEHETKEVTQTVVVTPAKGDRPAVTRERKLHVATGRITATSLEHTDVAGEGGSAKEALANMHAAINTKLAAKKAAEAKAADEDEAEAADVAEALHHSVPPPAPLVTREG